MADIGAQLRDARTRAKIDITEVEVRTKIRAKYLRAMENEEWDLLPGDVYVRSFLRTYGEFLGLDPRQLVDDFRREYENPSDHEPPPIAPPSRERRERERQRQQRPRRGIPPSAVIVLVLVIVAAVLYIVGTGNNAPKQDTTRGAAGATTPHRRARHHDAADKARHRTVTAAKPRPKVVRLSLVATGEVYVCLVTGTGKVLIPGTIYNVGDTIPSETGATLKLTLGNGSVTMKVNGTPVAVPDASPIGLRFTPTGHTTLTGSQLPTCA